MSADFLSTHFAFLTSAEGWAAMVALVAMEVVLGIDNLIFISILTNKLPAENRAKARRLGIMAALLMRLVLLATLAYIVQLTTPVFTAFGHAFSWRDLILIAGGLFLVWKATKEIHHTVDPQDHKDDIVGHTINVSMGAAIFQILLLDLVFSVDSIITAVGMTEHLAIMYIAVIVAITVMLVASGPVAAFIEKPNDRHACPRLSPDDRDDADRRRLWFPRSQGIYLCSHGVLGARRRPEYAGSPTSSQSRDRFA